jgi:hypothetical protein
VTKHLVWVALAALLLAGCPESSEGGSDVDAKRLSALKGEPVLRLSVQTYAEEGFRVSGKLPLHRSKVTADLNKTKDDGDRERAAEAVKALRDSGWTVFHARCEAAAFAAAAYKLVDGVSFYAQIDGSEVQQSQNVVLQMRAPHSRESKSDLFPERPPALAAGKTCLESAGSMGEEGTSIVVDELGPDPDGPAKPAGHR